MNKIDQLTLLNVQGEVDAQLKLRALRIEEQEALTAKAKAALKVQEIILELATEHRRTIAPMYRLGHDPGLVDVQARALATWLESITEEHTEGFYFVDLGRIDLDAIRAVLRMEGE